MNENIYDTASEEITESSALPEDESETFAENKSGSTTPSEAVGAEAEEINADPENGANELEALRAEVSALRAQLEGERAIYGRMSAECAEFSELYPDVPLSDIPDSIWENVKRGVPIAAAYALRERKDFIMRAKATAVNSANLRASSGSVDSSPSEEYYTPDEVRAMSPAEVRSNYSSIIRSMSKWH